MLNNEKVVSYYTLVMSNFLAALGGATILGRGVDVLNISYLKGNSLLAFFIGAVLGIFFLQGIPKKASRKLAPWFPILCALTSFLLWGVFKKYAIQGQLFDSPGIWFFILLCFRFSFWFFSRVLRLSTAASQNQTVALIEFSYYAGIIAGMLICSVFDVSVGMEAALLIDIVFQFFAGILDLTVSNRIRRNELEYQELPQMSEERPDVLVSPETANMVLCWRLALAVIAVIIGTQGIVFVLTHSFSSVFVTSILAIYYFGASVSAIFCKKTKIHLLWKKTKGATEKAQICFTVQGKEKAVSFCSIVLGCVICVEMLIIMTHVAFNHSDASLINPQGFLQTAFLVFAFSAGFFSEMLSVTILDRIGVEEKGSTNKNMIMRTYSLMAIVMTLAFWIMGFFTSVLFTFTVILLASFSFVLLSLNKKKRGVTETT